MLKLGIIIFLLLFPGCLLAQEPEKGISVVEARKLEMQLQQYMDEASSISGSFGITTLSSINSQKERLNLLQLKWKSFSELEQPLLAEDDLLMEGVQQVNNMISAAADSLEQQRVRLEALEEFDKVEQEFGASLMDKYMQYEKDAEKYALTKQTAALLQRLKTKEVLEFERIQELFRRAKNAAALNSKLSSRMEAMEQDFITIQNVSEKIQAMEYRPFIARIKDYLLSLACVAILFMFINMLKSQIAAAKAAKKAARQYKDMFNNNDDECPTI